ncbi:MAG: VanZ family protein [Myxococcota bacterium]
MSRARTDALPARTWLAWGGWALWTAVALVLGGDRFDAGSTSRLLVGFVEWWFPEAGAAEIARYAGIVRKLAHPGVYGVHAALGFWALFASRVPSAGRAALWATGAALGVAILDETRQATLATRTGAAGDVVLDTLGAAAVSFALWRWQRGHGYAQERTSHG